MEHFIGKQFPTIHLKTKIISLKNIDFPQKKHILKHISDTQFCFLCTDISVSKLIDLKKLSISFIK